MGFGTRFSAKKKASNCLNFVFKDQIPTFFFKISATFFLLETELKQFFFTQSLKDTRNKNKNENNRTRTKTRMQQDPNKM